MCDQQISPNTGNNILFKVAFIFEELLDSVKPYKIWIFPESVRHLCVSETDKLFIQSMITLCIELQKLEVCQENNTRRQELITNLKMYRDLVTLKTFESDLQNSVVLFKDRTFEPACIKQFEVDVGVDGNVGAMNSHVTDIEVAMNTLDQKLRYFEYSYPNYSTLLPFQFSAKVWVTLMLSDNWSVVDEITESPSSADFKLSTLFKSMGTITLYYIPNM